MQREVILIERLLKIVLFFNPALFPAVDIFINDFPHNSRMYIIGVLINWKLIYVPNTNNVYAMKKH